MSYARPRVFGIVYFKTDLEFFEIRRYILSKGCKFSGYVRELIIKDITLAKQRGKL